MSSRWLRWLKSWRSPVREHVIASPKRYASAAAALCPFFRECARTAMCPIATCGAPVPVPFARGRGAITEQVMRSARGPGGVGGAEPPDRDVLWRSRNT